MRKFYVGKSVFQLLSILCFTWLTGASQAQEVWNVEALLSQFASVSKHRYHYKETKHVAFLTDPIESEGILSFEMPNILEKIVTRPTNDQFRIVGDKLYIKKSGKQERKVYLSNYPEFLALAEGLRATFAGNHLELSKYYRMHLQGDRSNWTLHLIPVDIDLIKEIEFIEIKGQKKELKRVLVKEVDGDQSVLTVADS